MKNNATELRQEANVLRLLAMLVGTGIPFVESFELTAIAFPLWKDPLAEISKLLNSHKTGDLVLKYNGQFSFFVPAMLHLHIESGSLDKAFAEACRVVEKTARLVQAGVSVEKIAEVNFLRLLGSLSLGHNGIIWTLKVLEGVGLPSGVVADIGKQVREGGALAESLVSHPECFDRTAINYVDMGEQCGAVPELCERAAQIKEQQLLMVSGKNCVLPLPEQNILDDLADYDFLFVMVSSVGGFIPKSIERFIRDGQFKRQAFASLADKVENGSSLGDAMKSMSDDFPAYIAKMVELGEETGNLDKSLERIAGYLRWQHLRIDEPMPSAMSVLA